MNLTLIRHLPTNFNKNKILQGSIDNNILVISEGDRKLISNNINKLREINFDLIMTSSLKRTIQTAKAYGYFNFKIESLSNEIDFGSFEGLSRETLFNRHKFEWYNDMKKIPLGESFDNFSERVKKFIKTYQKYSHILLFGHGAFLRALIAYSKFIPLEKMNNILIEHNQIVKIQIDE